MPCKIGGVLCENHALGCKSSCEKWSKYQEEVTMYREMRNEAKSLDVNFYAYREYSMSRNDMIRNIKSQKKYRGGKYN